MDGKLKIAFVCPRYLTAQAGGAEVLCRQLAIQLADRGHVVSLVSTCAVNPATWENERSPEKFKDGSVNVELFKVDPRSDLGPFLEVQNKINTLQKISEEELNVWIGNSLNSTDLYQFIEDQYNYFDYFIFAPYLFGLTIVGADKAKDKAVLIPCLHDESFIHLDCFKRLFKQSKKILFNAPPEYELARRVYDVDPKKCFLVGMGFDSKNQVNVDSFKKKNGIHLPYITYVGRREAGKNFDYLLEMVRVFQKAYPGQLQFVTVGSNEVHLLDSEKDRIIDLGFVSEEDKQACFQGALINCQPSTNESFSIVLMESWLTKRPVLVNKRCDVTNYWVEQSKGGFSFEGYFDFEQTLVWALKNQEALNEIGLNGQYYVEKNFSWDVIIKRLEKALLQKQ